MSDDSLTETSTNAAPSAADVLLKLAERCEREDASPELDEAIAVALGWGWVGLSPRWWAPPEIGVKALQQKLRAGEAVSLDPRCTLAMPPRWTSSLDAAVTLANSAADWKVETVRGTRAISTVWSFGRNFKGASATPALALCAAALRARAALMAQKQIQSRSGT